MPVETCFCLFLLGSFSLISVSNLLVDCVQCGSGGYEDTIGSAFSGASSGALDSQGGMVQYHFSLFVIHNCALIITIHFARCYV